VYYNTLSKKYQEFQMEKVNFLKDQQLLHPFEQTNDSFVQDMPEK
jgi:hypothetical protein